MNGSTPRRLSAAEEAAIAQANANLAAMADDYGAWAARDLETALAQISVMKTRGPTPRDIFELFRTLHNIKGQGGTFGFHLITAVATIACDILRERRSIAPDALEVTEGCVRVMRTLLRRRSTGDGGADGAALLSRLTAAAEPHIDGTH